MKLLLVIEIIIVKLKALMILTLTMYRLPKKEDLLNKMLLIIIKTN